MTQQYMGALKQVKRLMDDSLGSYSQNSMSQLEDLCVSMCETKLLDVDYLKLMELYGRKYKKEKNETALRFVLMRMQQLMQARNNANLHSQFPGIAFTDYKLDGSTAEFLKGYPFLLRTFEQRYKVRILQMATLTFVVALILLVLLFHFSFLKVWFLLWILFGIFVYRNFKYGYAAIEKAEILSYRDGIDFALKALDEKQVL